MSGEARALGWVGTVVPRVKVLGVVVDVVVRVDVVAHAARRAGPVLDRDVLATWEWPEAVREPEVVRLVGVVATGTHWRGALRDAVRLSGFCAVAIVGVDEERCRLECAYAGVGLVVEGTVVVVPRGGRAVGARRRTLDRWVEELVYQRLIVDGVLEPVARPSATP
ncbi:hypothetical protein ACFFQW_08965 [Umezawaea endophytica]|uniref:Uncharacterized protein n=1 Tax=Umezawaea endophytica TaxID=1654476 RepID=A0A9X3ADF6_9PSEU|nr:hypothetical protein [Umezawaea endophytica]MCS7476117.1 hypothetical protein [Umezawaea endophytica]